MMFSLLVAVATKAASDEYKPAYTPKPSYKPKPSKVPCGNPPEGKKFANDKNAQTEIESLARDECFVDIITCGDVIPNGKKFKDGKNKDSEIENVEDRDTECFCNKIYCEAPPKGKKFANNKNAQTEIERLGARDECFVKKITCGDVIPNGKKFKDGKNKDSEIEKVEDRDEECFCDIVLYCEAPNDNQEFARKDAADAESPKYTAESVITSEEERHMCFCEKCGLDEPNETYEPSKKNCCPVDPVEKPEPEYTPEEMPEPEAEEPELEETPELEEPEHVAVEGPEPVVDDSLDAVQGPVVQDTATAAARATAGATAGNLRASDSAVMRVGSTLLTLALCSL